jgi:hypothetical protein
MQSNPPEAIHAGSSYEHPIYWALPGDPEYEVRCVSPAFFCQLAGTRIKLPAVAVPAEGSDGHLAVVQPDGTEDDFWQAAISQSAKTISAPSGNAGSITGSGTETFETAAGFNLAAGIIMPQEFLAGTIHHALFVVVHECAGQVAPATHNDCGSGENLPAEGTHLWLSDEGGWIEKGGYPKWKEGVLLALNHYGAYVGDKGGSGFSFQAEDEHPWTVFGEPEPLRVDGEEQHQPLLEGGSYRYKLSEGVEWAKYLRVLAPPST